MGEEKKECMSVGKITCAHLLLTSSWGEERGKESKGRNTGKRDTAPHQKGGNRMRKTFFAVGTPPTLACTLGSQRGGIKKSQDSPKYHGVDS